MADLLRVTEVLEGVGFDMSHLPLSYSERGTFVHWCMELKAWSCEMPKIPEEWKGFVDAGLQFWDDIKPQPVLVEPEIVHDLLGLVGHPDLLAEEIYWHDLYDYKTGSVPLYTGPQLAGYKILIQRKFPHIKHIKRTGVLLQPNGKYKLVPFRDDARDEATFMEAYHGYMKRRGFKWSFRK